jgi:hypothetical protein
MLSVHTDSGRSPARASLTHSVARRSTTRTKRKTLFETWHHSYMILSPHAPRRPPSPSHQLPICPSVANLAITIANYRYKSQLLPPPTAQACRALACRSELVITLQPGTVWAVAAASGETNSSTNALILFVFPLRHHHGRRPYIRHHRHPHPNRRCGYCPP